MPPEVVRIRASSTVLVKASSLVNLDFGAISCVLRGVQVNCWCSVSTTPSTESSRFHSLSLHVARRSTERYNKGPNYDELANMEAGKVTTELELLVHPNSERCCLSIEGWHQHCNSSRRSDLDSRNTGTPMHDASLVLHKSNPYPDMDCPENPKSPYNIKLPQFILRPSWPSLQCLAPSWPCPPRVSSGRRQSP